MLELVSSFWIHHQPIAQKKRSRKGIRVTAWA